MWDKEESGQRAEWQGHIPGGRKGRKEEGGGGGVRGVVLAGWEMKMMEMSRKQTSTSFFLPCVISTPSLPQSPKPLDMDCQVSYCPKAAEEWTAPACCQIAKGDNHCRWEEMAQGPGLQELLVPPGGLEVFQPAPRPQSIPCVVPGDPGLRSASECGKQPSRLQRGQPRGSCRLSRRHRLHV